MFRQSIPLPAVIARLHELCEGRQTGTVYILENGHLTGQFGLQAGEIVSLIAQEKRGTDALSCLLDIKNYGIAFAPGTLAPERMSLPPTSEILAILDSFIAHGAEPQPKPSPSPSPSPSPPSLTGDAKTVLEQTLREFIGPIANMVCADHFSTATTLTDAIDALAAEMPNPKMALQFRKRVIQRLM